MKYFLLGLFIGFSLLPASAVAGQSQPLTIIELYTSQGCSSCPPADNLLGELAQRDDVLALSFHVDYWNYIGWTDPFASAQYTKRQRAYARYMDLRYIYTPQMVVNGAFEASGLKPAVIDDFIASAKLLPQVPIMLKQRDNSEIEVSIQPWDAAQGSLAGQTFVVWAAVYDKKHSTSVKRGENTGHTINNYNVVRNFRKVGNWDGNAHGFTVSLQGLRENGGEACAVFIQSEQTGRIMGAANLDL